MNKTLKIYILITLGFLLFYSDFARDYVFKNLEYQIHYLSHLNPEGIATTDNYTDSWMEARLENYTIENIINLKWIFTIIFTFYFFILSAGIPFIIYQKKETIKFAAILYTLLFITALIIYILRFISDGYVWQENTYLISLGIMHFLQSSLPTILLAISFKLHLSFNSETKK